MPGGVAAATARTITAGGRVTQGNEGRERVSGVAYDEVAADYFATRRLRRYAGVGSLWALGVGAVISGDFFGWNFGLAAGGFGGLLAATLVVTAMYAGLCFSIAEMTAALPHTGGAYSFARSAMGPWGAYVTGIAENMEYILTPSVIVVGIGAYLRAIGNLPESSEPWLWLATYALFVGLNVAGVEATFRFTVFITAVALAILAAFYAAAIPRFDAANARLPGAEPWFLHGGAGVFAALPFAVWFYLAIEQLPLAAEEAHAPERDLPRGIVLGLATLIACSFLTLVLSAGLAPGTAALGHSDKPLFESLRAIFGDLGTRVFALAAVAGLVASFHTIIFAYGRQIYSLSRAGYFPRWLSVTHGRRQTPHRALLSGAVIGYAVALAVFLLGPTHPVGAVLLNLAVFGAVISYALQMLSFVLLRVRRPGIARPYRSPLGVPGAVVALAIALVTLGALFASDPIYRGVAIAALLWVMLGLSYFAVWGRHRLVKSPEEDFALRAARGDSSAHP
jgi:ethanolamine permease